MLKLKYWKKFRAKHACQMKFGESISANLVRLALTFNLKIRLSGLKPLDYPN
jgi:hypothetical protein